MKYIVSIALALTQTACLTALFGSQDAKSRSYKLPQPGEAWEAVDPLEADSAYRHREEGSILTVNSICGDERLRELDLLAADVMRQLPEATLVAPLQSFTIRGLPATRGEMSGLIDGHPLEVNFAVIRSPLCVYDIILANSELTDVSRQAFEKTLSEFEENAKR